ncbi:glucuronate isomerase [Rhodohalobacter sp. SW132]|uniref:glucuronate isomerase n=1 Tax=Rhodohalobacter sp. SW132 TaxID=2293433 RepID=UPI000E24DD81|nr:glucuronate isomerase [Rhodohalobacter sp. SW132]REL33173.1 glucuronate isomerase [Rhodohalobacter sp. SW132]
MKPFLNEHFLLETDTAKSLYHDYASPQPIIDYHCHLPPDAIDHDKNFDNLTKIWLDGDHYKWRAMRAFGIDEKYITGDAPDKEKFLKWAETVPYTVRNPLYHWTHMELKNYFGIDKLLNPETAEEIYDQCTKDLQKPEFSTRSLLKRMNVEIVCTTDDPVDNLKHHQNISKNPFGIKVLPAFRPDKSYAFDEPGTYNSYIDQLSDVSGIEIKTLTDLYDALQSRIDYFHDNGCKLSDHGLEKIVYANLSPSELEDAFKQVRKGNKLSIDQKYGLTYAILIELGKMYENINWVQQYHLGALRNTNDRMLNELGPDTGFDSIGDFSQSRNLSRFLNQLDSTDQLAKTILYNLNPADNEVMASMIGNYNDGSVKGKMQYGSAWWFLDQKDGMEKQMNTLSNIGLLSCFVGMLTDSRSFLSFPRHEYFRRILCNLMGSDVENGELPNDLDLLGEIVSDICYNNANEYFDF